MKTSELTGPALDWAVARANGHIDDETIIRRLEPDEDGWCIAYSTDWSQGGPIIERERITLDGTAILNQWMAVFYVPDEEPWEMRGPTPLIAAMRCFVASKLGDEIELPKDFL
jgi:hypothetical protein